MSEPSRVRVFAHIGPFATVAEAAVAEDSVEWRGAAGDGQRACTVCFAASEVAAHLGLVDGVEPALHDLPSDLRPPRDVPCVFLLSREDAALARGLPVSATAPDAPESYAIASWGSAQARSYLVVGSDRVGVLYGAYDLLRALGFRWLSPDPGDTIVPARLEWPAVSGAESPAFSSRGFWATSDRGTPEFLLWMARNKLNLWAAEQSWKELCRKLGMRFITGGHDVFARYAPPERYFEEHPEWYGLRGGARSSDIRGDVGDNVCLSNAAARAAIAANLVEDLSKGERSWVDIVNVWALDNGKYCECGACAAAGNPTDQILLLAHDCRAAINAARLQGRLARDVLVAVPAYHESLLPPSRPLPDGFDHDGILVVFFPIERCFAHTFTDAACQEINADMLRSWELWTRNPANPFRGSLFMGEYYNVSSFSALSLPFTRVMAADIPYYHASGTRHMHYMHVTTAAWGTLALTNTLFAALLWDAKLDVDAFVGDFCAQRYGELATQMRRFYGLLEEAMRNSKPLKHYAGMKRASLFGALRRHRGQSARAARAREKASDADGLARDQAGGEAPDPGAAGRTRRAADAAAVVLATRHLPYAPREQAVDDGPSLVQTMALLEEAGALLDQALLEGADPAVVGRLVADSRRFRYTRTMVRFLYHFARLRMFEEAGFDGAARLEALALRDHGEALRAETEMVAHNWDEVTRQYRFYDNGLTASWVAEQYAEVMLAYGIEVPPVPEIVPRARPRPA